MKATSVKAAAEMAADFIFHYVEDIGAETADAVEQAQQIYSYICGEELDVEAVLGLDPEEYSEN